ncbi:hypothetical protein J6590_031680 [Homalodisca vitripennis]|nr:hypothetical protein J6590_031680 [Homalodisca vitripennis]
MNDVRSCNASDICKEQPETVQKECLTDLQVDSKMEIGKQEDLSLCMSISPQDTNKDNEDDADGVF